MLQHRDNFTFTLLQTSLFKYDSFEIYQQTVYRHMFGTNMLRYDYEHNMLLPCTHKTLNDTFSHVSW